jgi:hypothetical protein
MGPRPSRKHISTKGRAEISAELEGKVWRVKEDVGRELTWNGLGDIVSSLRRGHCEHGDTDEGNRDSEF